MVGSLDQALRRWSMANCDARKRRVAFTLYLIKDVAEKHGVTNLVGLNVDPSESDSYKKAQIKHATIYIRTRQYVQVVSQYNIFLVFLGFRGRFRYLTDPGIGLF